MRLALACLAIACTTAPPPAATAMSRSSFCAQGVPGLNHACVREFAVAGEIIDGAYVTTLFTQGNLGAADRRASADSLGNGDCSSPPEGMSAETCRELVPAVCSPTVLTTALQQSGSHETLATVDCHGGWAVASSPSGEHVFRFLQGAWHAVTQVGTSCHDWFLSAGVPIDACEAYHTKQAALTATR